MSCWIRQWIKKVKEQEVVSVGLTDAEQVPLLFPPGRARSVTEKSIPHRRRGGYVFIVALAVAIWVGGVEGCKKAPLIAPDTAKLVVSVNPASIPAGGQSLVRVVGFKASGTPLPDGTLIFFSANFGSIEPRKEIRDGFTEVWFRSTDDRSGLVTLTIASGDAEVTPDPIQITVGSLALKTLNLTADPQSLPVGGGFSRIIVTARDQELNPLRGVKIHMTTDNGQLNSKGAAITSNDSGVAEDLLQTTKTAHLSASAGEVSGNITISVSDNQSPKADFAVSPDSIRPGDKVYFNASASSDPDGQIISYKWDFGDGGSGAGVKQNHKYATPRNYRVVLTVTDNDGASGTAVQNVPVASGTAPTASFIYSPNQPEVNQDVYFNASGSSDPDSAIISYEWDFGDGRVGTGKTVTHRYADAGSYRVILVIADEQDNRDSAEQTVQVSSNSAPVARFEFSPSNPKISQQVTFNGAGSSDPDGAIVSWLWNFGDGGAASGVQATHVFTSAGSYYVVLTVADNHQNKSSAGQTINVATGQSPTAVISYSPSPVITGDTVQFSGEQSVDRDGTITSWQWDFGDGALGSGSRTTHIYAAAGAYNVSLTVQDNDKNKTSAQTSVTVKNNQNPTALFSYSPSSPNAGDSVYFDASSSSDADGTIISYSWSFGDGDSTGGSGSSFRNVNHTYGASGVYTVILTVADDRGGTDTETKSITIL